MSRYSNKIALVTGAGHGIGLAIARQLGTEGASLALLDIAEERGRAAAAELERGGIRAIFVRADITRPEEIEAAAARVQEELGPVGLLVANAAFTDLGNYSQATTGRWAREVDVNLNGTYNTIHAFLPGMVERRKGAVVVISSVNGLRYFGNPAYSAAKAGLINLTKSIACEYGKFGIRCNAVCPGSVRTQNESWQNRVLRDPEIFVKLARWYPLGRVAEPEDVASVVAFLGSEEARYVTGVALPVDGGLLAGMNVMMAELEP